MSQTSLSTWAGGSLALSMTMTWSTWGAMAAMTCASSSGRLCVRMTAALFTA